MRCPVDGTELKMANRHGIEIDYCPQCRGVWLNRGELDKIIERSIALIRPGWHQDYKEHYPPERYQPESYEGGYERSYERRGYERKKRKGSFLEDLFDFG